MRGKKRIVIVFLILIEWILSYTRVLIFFGQYLNIDHTFKNENSSTKKFVNERVLWIRRICESINDRRISLVKLFMSSITGRSLTRFCFFRFIHKTPHIDWLYRRHVKVLKSFYCKIESSINLFHRIIFIFKSIIKVVNKTLVQHWLHIYKINPYHSLSSSVSLFFL